MVHFQASTDQVILTWSWGSWEGTHLEHQALGGISTQVHRQ